MGERKEQTNSAVERELWGAMFRRLIPWTAKRHRLDPADAEEMVQEAIRQYLEAGGVPDSGDVQGLLRSLGSRINGIAVDRGRKKALRAVKLTDDGSLAEPDELFEPEWQILGADIARKALSCLLDRVDGDELVFSIIMQFAEGVEDPSEQAKALSRKVLEVYNARRRLKTHLEVIKKLMEGW